MKDLSTSPDETVLDVLEHARVGMLRIDGSGQHGQPMTHYVDRDAKALWFITASDTDLVSAVNAGGEAHHCVISDDNNYVCAMGRLSVSSDRAKLNELWSPVADAWFKGGKDDPKVCLLRMDLSEAAIWTSTDSSIFFGWEILKANLSDGHTPDVGDHTVVNFAA